MVAAPQPLLVDFLRAPLVPAPGRLGLTHAPGRTYDGAPSRDLAADLDALVAHGTRHLVSLVEAQELGALGIPNLVEEASARGLVVTRFPVPDFGVPRDLDATRALVARILDELRAGDTVVVHCRAGRGRTGMIAACCIAAHGIGPKDALDRLRAVRPGTVETPVQELFVVTFAASIPPARRRRRKPG